MQQKQWNIKQQRQWHSQTLGVYLVLLAPDDGRQVGRERHLLVVARAARRRAQVHVLHALQALHATPSLQRKATRLHCNQLRTSQFAVNGKARTLMIHAGVQSLTNHAKRGGAQVHPHAAI